MTALAEKAFELVLLDTPTPHLWPITALIDIRLTWLVIDASDTADL